MRTVSSPATMSVTPLVRRPVTKSGPALRPTTATNPASPSDSNTQSVGPGMRPKKRGNIERSHPHTSPPSRTPTLRLSPISIPKSASAGSPISAPATIPNATRTISVTSVARSGTDAFHGLSDPSAGSHEGEHVAALDRRRRKHRDWCAGPGDVPEIDSPRRLLVCELGKCATIDAGVGDHDIEHIGRDVEERPVVDLQNAKLLFVHPRHQQLPPARDCEDVAGLHCCRFIGIYDLIPASNPFDEQT